MPDGSVKHIHVVAHATERCAGRARICRRVDGRHRRQARAGGSAPGASRARPCHARDHARRADGLDRARGQPAARRHRHQWRGQPALARRTPPDLAEARERHRAASIRDGNRASEVIRRLRALRRKTEPQMAPLDINDVINDVVALVQRELLEPPRAASARSRRSASRRRRRPGPAAAGDHQSRDQRHRGHGARRPSGRASCAIRSRPHARRIRSWLRCRIPAWASIPSSMDRTVQCLLHHQARRHGHGAVDLPLDHRGAWRRVVGLA